MVRCRIALCIMLLLLAPAPAAGAGWKTVAEEDGVKVMLRDVPGRSFPTFRSVTVVKESIYNVLAVMSDVGRYKTWMARCSASERLQQRGDFEYVMYARTDAPWPVDDRDAVYHARVTVSPKQRMVLVRFHAVRDHRRPRVDGVVRLTNLRGYYALKMLGPGMTQMDYQIDADPGGWVPAWVGKITVKHAVIDTARALRKQIAKTRGWYRKHIDRWKRMALIPAVS